MRRMYWQLGILGAISAFTYIDTGKPNKTCVEMAGRRTFHVLTSSQQSGI
jgi:hypothetical protein